MTGVQVTAGNAQVVVSWQIPADDGGADLSDTAVEVYNAADPVPIPGVRRTIERAEATTATIGQLTDGASYYAQISVENTSYYGSAPVQTADFTPVAGPQPAPPGSVTAQPGTGQATVSWTAPGSDGGSPVTGYVVTAYDTSSNVTGSPVTVGASTAGTVLTGLTNGDTYYFGVAAANSAGTGPETDSPEVTPAAPPSAPTSVQVFPSSGELFVSWSPPDDDGGSPVTDYVVTVNSGSTQVGQSTVSGTGALVSGLTNGTPYAVTVTAANAAANGTAPAAPPRPAPSSQDLEAGRRTDTIAPGFGHHAGAGLAGRFRFHRVRQRPLCLLRRV